MNNREVETWLPAGTTVLDFIRQHEKLPGSKEGCREGECGACTILMGELNGHGVVYKAVASCLLPLGEVDGKHIVTIEGINREGKELTPVQQAMVDEGASQCGFCTPGIVVSLTGFFLTSESLDYREAIDAVDGNICRCTGYVPIQRAAGKLCDSFASRLDKNKDRMGQLVRWSVLPDYFLHIPGRLKALKLDPDAHEGIDDIVVAGATDLFVREPDELLDKPLGFVSRQGLDFIKKENNMITIGAGTTVEEIKNSPLIDEIIPSMKEYLNLVSSTIMRNRATLGGNIVNASPIGDLTVIFLALNARIGLGTKDAERELYLKDFFKGYKQLDMRAGEIVKFVKFPYPGSGFRFHFEKVSQRRYLDIASCNSAISIKTDGSTIHDIHLSAGGVAPVPFYLEKTCRYLRGKEVTVDNIQEAVKIAQQEISPISDVRGSAQYKTLLLRNLIFTHFITLFNGKSKVIKSFLGGPGGQFFKKAPLAAGGINEKF